MELRVSFPSPRQGEGWGERDPAKIYRTKRKEKWLRRRFGTKRWRP
jgi:hypothetical protein